MLSENREVVANKKQELQEREEKTVPGKYYVPKTDIVESGDVLKVLMDMPGVKKENLKIKLENSVLEVEGLIDSEMYENCTPLYSEYNVGHFTRTFKISNQIDQNKIEAKMEDGTLVVTLPKLPEAKPRQITIH